MALLKFVFKIKYSKLKTICGKMFYMFPGFHRYFICKIWTSRIQDMMFGRFLLYQTKKRNLKIYIHVVNYCWLVPTDQLI